MIRLFLSYIRELVLPHVTVKLASEVPVWKRKLKLLLTKILRQLITFYGTTARNKL